MEKWMTVAEASKVLGKSRRTIRREMEQGFYEVMSLAARDSYERIEFILVAGEFEVRETVF
jgi:IS30 family transposase